ncbi:MAG: Nramp family metal ion transport protein [candidate division Zixibacteria bacterium RBG-1]|nr:MAG: Nramp family metal ion transport protein [candidate division Zixibacteria bacterium RBG-1]OGC84241.1 MAG: Mn transporter [candidate division Zixibacteria bacterium RBG_19FT_COMBO_42_43]
MPIKRPKTLKQRWKKILIFLSIMGPGIITSNVDNDAGGITTYSLAGAQFGYAFLWTLIPITLALIVVQDMSARMGVVTGKGLSDLIRERFGVKTTFYVLLALFLANLGNIIANFAGIASALEILNIKRQIVVPLAAIFIWLLAVKGNYRSIEKVFLGASAFYITYIITGFMVEPEWGQVEGGFLNPKVSFDPASLSMLLGLIGTTIAPWMQFYLQSSIVEKNIKIRDYKHSRLDVILGSIIVSVVVFFIIMVCAATLFKNGIRIETAKDAALALEPLVGQYSALLFSFGLLNASLFAASIIPLSTAYTICEGMGWEEGVNKKFSEAPQFFGLYTLLIAVGAIAILSPRIPLIPIMYISQVINGILLPLILIFMLMLINNPKIMGKYTNSKFYNYVTILLIIIIVISTIALFYFGLKA